jgi:hypothetical protein
MKLTRTEELTLGLARGASGKAGEGQILTLLLAALVAGTSLRVHVDLGLVCCAACLVGVLSVLERRQMFEIIQKLGRTHEGDPDRAAAGRTA